MKKTLLSLWMLFLATTWLSFANVEEPVACTMDYNPVCAEVQVQCVTTPCDPVKQTFGNKCAMTANKNAKFLYEWECKTNQCPLLSQPSPEFCKEWEVVDWWKDANWCQLAPKCVQKTNDELKNCLSYFDWCNTCSVKDWKTLGCTKMFCEEKKETKCLVKADEKEQSPILNMANPASVNCEKVWWKLEMKNDNKWNQYWICKFNDKTECDEWELFRNQCKPWLSVKQKAVYKNIDKMMVKMFDKYEKLWKEKIKTTLLKKVNKVLETAKMTEKTRETYTLLKDYLENTK